MSYGDHRRKEPSVENVIAQCTLSQVPREDKVSYITPFWFYVKYGSKNWQFEHDNIIEVALSHHRFVGHVTIGGLLACFAAILLSKDLFDPFILLIILIGGLILLYYGWTGSAVLIVKERNDTTKIYLNEVPGELDAYLRFYKNYRSQQQQAMNIYHIATRTDWEADKNQYVHASLATEKFIHASTKEQVAPTFEKHFPASGDFLLLKIDVKALASPLKYEYVAQRSTSFPHIYGAINKSAVSDVLAFSSLKELQTILTSL